MAMIRLALLNSAAAAVLAVPLWTGVALAQEAQEAEDQGTDQAQQTQPSGEAEQGAGGQPGQGDPTDTLVARLGDAEIRSSDVMQAIGQLPPPLSRQPPEMLAATAIQQLILREAILQQAREAGLAQDPEVQSLVTAAAEAAEEDALLQVWLEREMQTRVPPQSVDQAYAALQAITTGELPPIEQLRGEIEQNLRRQAMEEVQNTLLTGADVTFFGPDGQPRAGTGQTGGAGQASGTGSGAGAGAEPASGSDTNAGPDAESATSGDAGATTDPGAAAGADDGAGAGTGTGSDAGGTGTNSGADSDSGTGSRG